MHEYGYDGMNSIDALIGLSKWLPSELERFGGFMGVKKGEINLHSKTTVKK